MYNKLRNENYLKSHFFKKMNPIYFNSFYKIHEQKKKTNGLNEKMVNIKFV